MMNHESGTSSTKADPAYWDPYRPEIVADPYPFFRRLRQEAPLFYNKEYDFYAVSRFSDVERCLLDKENLISSRGDVLEIIKSGIEVPPGMFIWEDPPVHTAHRGVLTRVFTPKAINDLEGKIRAYCVRCLDAKVGADRIDFIADLGAKLPGGVIGMLLGIPESDQEEVRQRIEDSMRSEAGKPKEVNPDAFTGEHYDEYIEWRVKHPSDDLMTQLLNITFQDETGTTRKLTREEILAFVNLLAGAGNETTAKLIGWIGKLLGDHPDQRRQIVANRSLVPAALEEILRFEPPGPAVARYVARDVEFHGQTVPAGSAILGLVASANRDDERFPDGDRFDIHRQVTTHITFSRGIHACLGAALARVEGRVALEEILKRFPEWTVDMDNARLFSSSTTRGWETLPAFIHH
jgi:cytochrome P450